ncbi:MAG TPA: SRPBCC family protein [Solirubrobacteraceae bacterium]|nr:SRPBCC family protein [Solirubrobacteraceae bacterium]
MSQPFDSRFMPQRRSFSRAMRTRRLIATPEALWRVVEDPFAMTRWWPNVARVEGVEDERFTLVFQTKRRRPVRMDFRVMTSDAPGSGGEPSGHRAWEQEVAGTPFERVLDEAITEVLIEPAHGGTSQVTIAQLQKLRGYSRTGALMLRRATNKRLDEALDGLARISG